MPTRIEDQDGAQDQCPRPIEIAIDAPRSTARAQTHAELLGLIGEAIEDGPPDAARGLHR